jgi:hypothetical protein
MSNPLGEVTASQPCNHYWLPVYRSAEPYLGVPAKGPIAVCIECGKRKFDPQDRGGEHE